MKPTPSSARWSRPHPICVALAAGTALLGSFGCSTAEGREPVTEATLPTRTPERVIGAQGVLGACPDGTMSCLRDTEEAGHALAYHAECPTGMTPHWDALTYRVELPENPSGSSHVHIQGRVGGASEVSGARDVARLTGSSHRDCSAERGCTVGLAEALGTDAEGRDVLELSLTLVPTPDGQKRPAMLDLEVAYSCVMSGV
jgi:hypothetical protein